MAKYGPCYSIYSRHLLFFTKIDMNQLTAQEHLLFKLSSVSLKQIEKFLHFSFKSVENFSNSKSRPPQAKKAGRKLDPSGSETCESLGIAWERGGGMVRLGID